MKGLPTSRRGLRHYSFARLANQLINYCIQVACLLVCRQLAISAGAFLHNTVDIFYLLTTANSSTISPMNHLDTVQESQIAHGTFLLLPKVNQLTIRP